MKGLHITGFSALCQQEFSHFLLQAIKCYETVLQAAAGRQLPAAEATLRLELASLLLAHTHNVTEARQHLEKAVRRP